MASACRSAAATAMSGARSLASVPNSLLSRTLAPKPIPTSAFASSTQPIARAASRIVAVLGSTESMRPLHSAVSSARLRSNIAVDSACWSEFPKILQFRCGKDHVAVFPENICMHFNGVTCTSSVHYYRLFLHPLCFWPFLLLISPFLSPNT